MFWFFEVSSENRFSTTKPVVFIYSFILGWFFQIFSPVDICSYFLFCLWNIMIVFSDLAILWLFAFKLKYLVLFSIYFLLSFFLPFQVEFSILNRVTQIYSIRLLKVFALHRLNKIVLVLRVTRSQLPTRWMNSLPIMWKYFN